MYLESFNFFEKSVEPHRIVGVRGCVDMCLSDFVMWACPKFVTDKLEMADRDTSLEARLPQYGAF